MSLSDVFIFSFVLLIFILGGWTLLKLRKISKKDRERMRLRNEAIRERKKAAPSETDRPSHTI